MADQVTVVVANKQHSKKYTIARQVFAQLYDRTLKYEFDSELLGLEMENKRLKITGASTNTGTPVYSAVIGGIYKKVAYKQNKAKGIQKKLRVYGNLITASINAIDTVVIG